MHISDDLIHSGDFPYLNQHKNLHPHQVLVIGVIHQFVLTQLNDFHPDSQLGQTSVILHYPSFKFRSVGKVCDYKLNLAVDSDSVKFI